LRTKLTRALVVLAGKFSVERGLVGLYGGASAATGSDSVSSKLKPAFRLRVTRERKRPRLALLALLYSERIVGHRERDVGRKRWPCPESAA